MEYFATVENLLDEIKKDNAQSQKSIKIVLMDRCDEDGFPEEWYPSKVSFDKHGNLDFHVDEDSLVPLTVEDLRNFLFSFEQHINLGGDISAILHNVLDEEGLPENWFISDILSSENSVDLVSSERSLVN